LLDIKDAIKSIAIDLAINIISDAISIIFHEKFVELVTSKSPDPLSQMLGLLSPGAIAAAAVFGYRIYKKLTGPIKEASINIYHRRNLKIENFLKRAKTDIYIFGITLEETLSGEYSETIEKILQSKDVKSMRILISAPCNTDMVASIKNLVDTDISSIDSSLNRIKEFRHNLEQEEKSKLEIKVFDGIPVQSLFILDPLSKKGVLRFEPYIYSIQKGKRRIYELPKKKDKELFQTYFSSYNTMWDCGKPVY
jgi:hypothetical protein